jgi:VCBS repeat protein
MRTSTHPLLLALLLLAACGGSEPPPVTPERFSGGPYPALLVAQAQFLPPVPGTKEPVPGPARLLIVRRTETGWKTFTLEDADSNVFHKALVFGDGFLTIGGNRAMLKLWRLVDGQWRADTKWNPTFGGKQDRLRDIERGDVDGDAHVDLVIATHDQGVIAVVHPEGDPWRIEEIDRQPNTFVHEIELGDVDGDGVAEIFATPSEPNKLETTQPGEVRMYKYGDDGWVRSTVDAPPDTHAKEILAADVDGDLVAELFVAWEGALGKDGTLLRPVTIKEYRWRDGRFESSVVATVPDRLLRALTAGDVNGDGKKDLVAGAMSSGLWLFEQSADGWKPTLIDAHSTGFEHPVCLADLDGDGALEIYVASEDQQELAQYRWTGNRFEKQVVAPLRKGDITWNITPGRF